MYIGLPSHLRYENGRSSYPNPMLPSELSGKKRQFLSPLKVADKKLYCRIKMTTKFTWGKILSKCTYVQCRKWPTFTYQWHPISSFFHQHKTSSILMIRHDFIVGLLQKFKTTENSPSRPVNFKLAGKPENHKWLGSDLLKKCHTMD
jgi:hypothetical protein